MEPFSLLLRVCGIGLLISVSLMLISRTAPGYGAILRIGGGLAVFAVVVLLLSESVESLREIPMISAGGTFVTEAFGVMLKALGIALIARFCSDVCKDCGENTLAGGIESVGRIAIFSLSLPMILDVIDLAGDILGLVD